MTYNSDTFIPDRSNDNDSKRFHLENSESLFVSNYALGRLKRSLDFVTAGIAIILLLPVFLAIALAIKLDASGPVLFRQLRAGLNGDLFYVLKFRTMRAETGKVAFRQACIGDPRVTPLGRWLRRTSLDELPQLFNVMRGEMSLVGPRPHPVELDDRYRECISQYERRVFVRPGISGLAQVRGARGETPTVDDMARRITFDLEYVATASLWVDLVVCLRTLREVVASERAF